MKKRLDLLVFDKGLAESREKAQRLVMAGLVLVSGKKETKSGMKFDEDAPLEVLEGAKYVGRGAEKIEAAAKEFGTDFQDKIVADIGSSTGGFTDFALQNGAKKVYAIDVGTGQLAWKLRNDERVVVMEKTNFRDIKELPEPIDVFVVDVSFVSVRRILEHLIGIMNYELRIRNKAESIHNSSFMIHNSDIVVLFKPQFEAGKKIADKFRGVIKDPEVHKALLQEFREWCNKNGFKILGEIESPIKGDKGNTEFLFHLKISN